MPHFMIVLIFFKAFLDNEMSIFEEYGAFKKSEILKACTVLVEAYHTCFC